MLSRRELIQRFAALSAVTLLPASTHAQPAAESSDALGRLLPTRALGRTGERTTMLGLGGSHFIQGSERDSQALAEATIEQGIRFIDSAVMYGRGESESRLGRLLFNVGDQRRHLYIMSKTKATDAKRTQQDIDDSRRRMGVDTIDLYQIHAIQDASDVDRRLDNGVLDTLVSARDKGHIRHIGFTGHSSPLAHVRMLERLQQMGVELDACQMPINVVDPQYASFIERVLPTLVERGYAVLAMKTLAFGQFFGRVTAWANRPEQTPRRLVPDTLSLEEAFGFVWSLPVSSLISGMTNPQELRENAELCRRFAPLEEPARVALLTRVADAGGIGMEFYKQVGVP